MKRIRNFLLAHREELRPQVLPKQLCQYQSNQAENYALLGDRILDLWLYQTQDLTERISDATAEFTQLRSKIFSNRNLAQLGDALFDCLLTENEWSLLSEKERGTFVEALVAACYCFEGKRFSDRFSAILEDIVRALSEPVLSTPAKNPVSMVLEWLQARQIPEPQNRFTTETLGVQPYQRFQTTIDFSFGMEWRSVTGPEALSKDEARRLAAELVLIELGLMASPSSEVKVVVSAPIVPPQEEGLFRDDMFDKQTLEREVWDAPQTLAWFRRKRQKKPYETTFLLRAQLQNAIEVAGWVGTLNEHFVAVLSAAFSDERYWAIGASQQSKSAARELAGEALHAKAPMEDWIRDALEEW